MIDIHNHTTFSDGRNTVEEIIHSAVDIGLQVVGFSDHFDPYVCQEVCLQPEQVSGYLKEIRSFDGELPIKVLAGLELGLQSEGILWPGEEMDYYLYSVHTVPGRPDLKSLEDPWEIYLQEATLAVDLIDRPGFFGHLDFLRRHIPFGRPPKPGPLMDRLLMKLVSNHVGLEVNTSGWMYGLGDPSPQSWVIERYLELGGNLLTIGSDSHRAQQVGKYSAQAVSLLKGIGVREVFYCENGSYVPFRILEEE